MMATTMTTTMATSDGAMGSSVTGYGDNNDGETGTDGYNGKTGNAGD